MASRPVVRVVVAIAAVAWAIGLTVQGVALEWSWVRWYSAAAGAAVLALVLFDRWLWRWWPFRLLARQPDLRGTWKGSLRSSWAGNSVDSATPTEAFLVIRQTYSTLSATLLTLESKSRSLVASLDLSKDTDPTLSYTYMNVPKLRHQERSRIHHGSAFLEIHGSPPDCLEGCYWTDRDTKGELEFRSRVAERHTEFPRANAAFPDRGKAVGHTDPSS